jgi:hypothetical protein
MTPDEELNKLEDGIRRLKIDYEVYFNGGAKRPPTDAQWRVERLLKKYSDNSSTLNYAQRFRYNGLAQRYGLFAERWRQRLQVREEGPRQRPGGQPRPEKKSRSEKKRRSSYRVEWRDPLAEPEKVERLFAAFVEAKRECGEQTDHLAAESFKRFVQQKTAQLKHDQNCEHVEYVVEVEDGQVKLKAKGR